ncbi:MAG: hypothetical protein NTV10_08600 [Methanoregula sp.]|nr:hypothetical protein [Methanoregula sp.]
MKTDEETGSKNVKVRLISQKTFDEMNGDEKTFYLDLIKKGQVKIADAKEDKPQSANRESTRSPFSWLRVRNVEVKLVTGDTIAGLLTDVWKNEIAIKTSDGPILIQKHAVTTIREIR